MYKIQFVNTFNQEILREATYSNSSEIKRMIMGFEKSGEINESTVIFCSNKKTWNAEYLFYKVVKEAKDTVYKMFFIVSLSVVQANIKNKRNQ